MARLPTAEGGSSLRHLLLVLDAQLVMFLQNILSMGFWLPREKLKLPLPRQEPQTHESVSRLSRQFRHPSRIGKY